jgi:Armadillo/beta-catenin-like repeat
VQDLDDDWQAQQNIVQTWALLSRCREGVCATLDAGFTTVVLDLARDALKDPDTSSQNLQMCRICVEFLVQLSHDEQGKAAILDANGIPVLGELLKVKDEKTVMNAVNALMGITIDPMGKVPTIQVRQIVREHGLSAWNCARTWAQCIVAAPSSTCLEHWNLVQIAGQRLIELLKGIQNMPVDVQHGCRAVLVNAAEHPVARKLLTIKLPPEEQTVFLGPLPLMPIDYMVSQLRS